jgi:hypothetical protein
MLSKSPRACLFAAAFAAGSACGPSVQSIYEGDVRFEHCYRLDLDPNIAAGHRQTCWQQWAERYSYGQTSDKIQYARRRLRALAAGDTSRPILQLEGAPTPAERQFYMVVPVPTSAHAPPMAVAKPYVARDVSVEPASKPKPPPAPGHDCAAECRGKWSDCLEPCKGDGGATQADREAKCQSCEEDFKKCMRRCYK